MLSIHLIPDTTIGLHQLMCPIDPCTAPSQHSMGDSGKGAEGRRKAHKTDHLAARQPQKRDTQTKEVFCSLLLTDTLTHHPSPTMMTGKVEMGNFPS